MRIKDKVITTVAMFVAVVAVGTATFYAQSSNGLAKEYRAQSAQLESVKLQRARQYSILIRIPTGADWKKATATVEKMTDKQVLDEFVKIGNKRTQ